jgi:hypothetical protein
MISAFEGSVVSLTSRHYVNYCVAENIPVNLKLLKMWGLRSCTALFRTKLRSCRLSQPSRSIQAFAVRVKTRVAHLRAHLGHLVDLGSWPESITVSYFRIAFLLG